MKKGLAVRNQKERARLAKKKRKRKRIIGEEKKKKECLGWSVWKQKEKERAV